MKKYGYYVIVWWDFENRKSCEKSFKMEKPAKKFAAKLADNSNAQYRQFFAYNSNFELIENFEF